MPRSASNPLASLDVPTYVWQGFLNEVTRKWPIPDFSRPTGLVTETVWHPTQQVTREEDGRILWRARVPGTVEIRRWILQWGAQVEVLAPPELRVEIEETYRRAVERY